MSHASTHFANSDASYGAVTKTFHWLTALLILTAIPLGFVAQNLPFETSEELARKAWLFSFHKTVGILAFFTALARILWALSQPKPGLLNADKTLEAWAAETVHWLLYASMLLVPLTGWIHHAAASGFAPIWWPFGQDLPLVPKSEPISGFFSGLHEVFGKVLIASILLHFLGAMKHHIIDRDDTLRRMLPGSVAPDVPPQHHSFVPLVAAAAIYAAAFGVTVFSAPSHEHGAQSHAAPELAAKASDWVVQDGALAIAVTQFGSEVAGEFSDWTASITFDPKAEGADVGSVEVEIAIASLTLGSVTNEALDPEFLDATNNPIANYTADLRKLEGEGAYEAVGTLSLKGTEAPLVLPFALSLEDGLAVVEGSTSLDRREFAIGTASYGDEETIAFEVSIAIALTASQSE
ncbi:MAG: cytochrome b/b6 domain-containing protein [Pseudomonadota bacterium]